MSKNTVISKKMVIYEDNHLFAINKPSGILSQGDKTGDASIVDIAKDYIKFKYKKPGNVFLGLSHRLDRPVSGALLMCRSSKALTRVNEMIRKREVTKTYLAIVNNRPPTEVGTISSYIGKNTSKNKAIISKKEFKNSKKAILNYRYIGLHGDYHLLAVNLETGRSHQIRAQLASIGCPILGDVKYARQRPLKDMSIALHSYRIELTHPVTKSDIRITASLPSTEWWNAVSDIADG